MKTFFQLLATALVAVAANNFVWFALSTSRSRTSSRETPRRSMGGIYLVMMAVSGIWFGSIVDHHRSGTP